MPSETVEDLSAPMPAPPVRQFSFTDFQVNNPTAPPPGDRLDAEFDRANNAIEDTITWASVSLNSDGSIRDGAIGNNQLVSGLFDDVAQDIIDEVQPLVDSAQGYASAAAASSHAAQASATAADVSNTSASGAASSAATSAGTATVQAAAANTSMLAAQTAATGASNSDNHAEGAAALAQDYADVTQAWAEHMPDTIPPNILAVMGVTGDHWSSRWWANRAASIVNATTGTATVIVSDSPPVNPSPGQLWFDSSSPELYVWYTDPNSSEWVIAAGNGGRGSVAFSLNDFLPSGQPDGVTDLTVYIQQAIDAAAGHFTLVIPASGNAYVTGTLYIPSNTHLVIDAGATLSLKAANGDGMFLITDDRVTRLRGVNNVYIELRGTLDGNAFNQNTARISGGISSLGSSGNGSTNIYIDGFQQGLITNFQNWPMGLGRVTNSEVRNLAMTNCGNSVGYNGVTSGGVTTKSYNVGFTNCTVQDIRDIGIVLYGGCESSYIRGCKLLNGASALIFLDNAQPGVNIDCEISGCFQSGGEGGIGTASNKIGVNNRNCRIFNNTIENVHGSGLQIGGVDYCEVYGNVVHDSGVSFAGTSGQSAQAFVSGCSHVNFHDNTIRNTTSPGYYSRHTTDTIASLASYNPTTGAVSLTTTAVHPIVVGDQFLINQCFGIGDYLRLNGFWTATAGTTGLTVNFTGPTGLTLTTLKAGGVLKYTNAVAVGITSGTYDPSTGNVVLTTSTPHGMPMTGDVPQAFVVSGITGTGPVANLNGYQVATAGTAGTTINFTATAGYGAMTITGGTVLPPTFGVSTYDTDYCRITNNFIGDWQTTPNMVACIGGLWGTDGYTEGNIYGPRLATGPWAGFPADATIYVTGSGTTQGPSFDSVLNVYSGGLGDRNIGGQTFFHNRALTLGWNLAGGAGEVDFFCGQGGGTRGGFNFFQVTNDGTISAATGVNGSLLANDGFGNTRLGGALVHGAMQTWGTLANAGTVTVTPNTSMVLIRNSASIASAAIVLPAPTASAYVAGSELELNFQNPIGAVTWSGATVSNAPTTVATAGASVNFINSGTVWLRRIAI